jgi:hypothetical protein
MSKNKSKVIFENTVRASKKPVLASITKLYDTSKTPERFAMDMSRIGCNKKLIKEEVFVFKQVIKILNNYQSKINSAGFINKNNKISSEDIAYQLKKYHFIDKLADSLTIGFNAASEYIESIDVILSYLNVDPQIVKYNKISLNKNFIGPYNVLDKEGNVHKDVNPSDMDELLSSDNSIVSDDYIYNVKDIKNFSFEYFSKLITQLKSVITNETNAKEDRKKIVKKLVEMANNSSRPYDAIFDTIEELGMFRETQDISDIVDEVVNELSDEMNKVLSKEVNK